MGILDLFTSQGRELLRAERDWKLANIQQETEILKTVTNHQSMMNRLNSSVLVNESIENPINDEPNGQTWQSVDGLSSKLAYGYSRQIAVDNVRQQYMLGTTIFQIIDNYRRYVVGTGATFKAEDGDKETQKAVDDYTDKYLDAFTQKEFVTRLVRDGEVFRYCPPGADPVFYDPERFSTVTQDARVIVTDGIEFDSSGKPVKYWYTSLNGDPTPLDARWMIHLRYGVDDNQIRGIPKITPGLFQLIQDYEGMEKARLIQVKFRSMLAVNYTVDGGPNSVASIKTGQDAAATGKTKAWRPGMIKYSNSGTKIEFTSPNVDASDTEVIARSNRIRIAAHAGLPEHLLWADGSNANYSSTRESAEEEWSAVNDIRSIVGRAFEIEIGWHLQRQIDNYTLSQSIQVTKPVMSEEPDEYGIIKTIIEDSTEVVPRMAKAKTVWPPMEQGNQESESKAISLDLTSGLVSKSTASSKRGYDWEHEQTMIAKEGMTKTPQQAESDMVAKRLEQELADRRQDADNPEE